MVTNIVSLGSTGINISSIGLGTMQWGDFKFTEQTNTQFEESFRKIFQVTIEAGINFFDTAEMYGNGRSEILLGECLKETSNKVIVATKFMPFPWRLSKGELRSALMRSLKRLGLNCIDLYQVHWPFPPVPIKSWMDAMADAVAEGLIRAIGVSNYSPAQMRVAFAALAKHKIPLASNQVKFSLLDQRPEQSGLVALCQELGITIIAYSPLEKGILTGKYTSVNLPPGLRSWRYNKAFLMKIDPLMKMIRETGSLHGGKTPAEVALNWLVCKGAVPIPGAKSLEQARENARGIGWELSSGEVANLDAISAAMDL